MDVKKSLALALASPIIGALITYVSSCVITHLDLHQHSFVIHQTIDVPNASLGRTTQGVNGADFFWREITATKAFARKLASKLYGDGSPFLPPEFEADVFSDELSAELPDSWHSLSLRMFVSYQDYSESDIKKYLAGRELFMEEIESRGIHGTPVGEPQVTLLPMRWPRRTSDLWPAVLPAALPGAIAGLCLGILFSRTDSKKKKNPPKG